MKNKTTAITLAAALLMLIFSCSPVPNPGRLNLMPVADGSTTAVNVTASSESAEVFFTPVAGADSYEIRYGIPSGDEKTYTVPTSSYSTSGMFEVKIRPLNPSTKYSVGVYAKNSANAGFIAVGGASFTTLEAGTLDYAPVAWLESRGQDSADIAISMTEGFFYSISILNPDGTVMKTVVPENGDATITGIAQDDTYTAVIYHGSSEEKISPYTTRIEIPAYSISYAENFTLSYSNGIVKAEGVPEEAISLSLYKRVDGNDSLIKKTDNPKETEFTLPISKSFESGIYHFIAETPSGNVSSSNQLITAGILVSSDEIGYQHITMNWDNGGYADGEVIYNTVVSGGINAKLDEERGNCTLSLSGLESKTEYSISIEAILPDKRICTTDLTLTTKDFSGVYQWINKTSPLNKKVGNFVITVENSPEESAYPYYIRVNSQDCYYNGTEYRVLPLIDDSYSSGESMPDGMIPYQSDESYAQAYRWNAGKWNKTSMSPAKWRIADYSIGSDVFKTTVNSTLSGSSSELPTETTWTFKEDSSGNPVLYFKNYSSSLLVSMGLYTNPDYETEGVDKYTFLLKRIADV